MTAIFPLKFLIENKKSIGIKTKDESAIWDLCEKGFTKKKEPAKKIGVNKETLLHIAAANNDVESILSLIRCGVSVDEKDKNGKKPLAFATTIFQEKITHFLAEKIPPKKRKNNQKIKTI